LEFTIFRIGSWEIFYVVEMRWRLLAWLTLLRIPRFFVYYLAIAAPSGAW